LPDQWQPLSPSIVEEVRAREEELSYDADLQLALRQLIYDDDDVHRSAAEGTETGVAERTAQRYREANAFAVAKVPNADVALTTTAHRALISELLAGGAHNVLIVSTDLTEKRAESARNLLIQLLDQGVNVDLLWTANSPQEDAARIINTLGATRRSSPSPNAHATATYNRKRGDVAAELILTDTDTGPLAVIGGDVFGDDPHVTGLHPAVRVVDHSTVAALARICAGWCEQTDPDDGNLPAHRWKHLAGQWAEDAVVARPESLYGQDAPGQLKGMNTISLYTETHRDAIRRNMTDDPSTRELMLSPMRRVLATPDRCLVEHLDTGGSGLSYVIAGPVAMDLWNRILNDDQNGSELHID
jgi:hypothetical protein